MDLQSAIIGFFDGKDDSALNNILLIFKLCLYRFRNKKIPDLNLFIKNLREREVLERKIVLFNDKKLAFHDNKWEFLTSMLHAN